MSLNVIGAGFGRTGTDSMRNALNTLGIGPTHHMTEVGKDPKRREHWLNIVDGAKPDWDWLFNDYNACVDWPSAFFWRSLSDQYPNAKIILTVRSAESWWDSFEATILKNILYGGDPNGFSNRLVSQRVFNGLADNREHAIDVYNRNTEDVLATVSPDRLLVHSLGDGWEPLCQFLNVPIPDMQYPSGNTRQEFNQRIERVAFESQNESSNGVL